MGKPKAPDPPDYAAAAKEQGTANLNAAVGTNFLNQADQVGPYGSLKYTYDYDNGYRTSDGTVIPKATATTILSPEQQKLLDQNTNLSINLNDLATKGLDYVDKATSSPVDISNLPQFVGGVDPRQFQTTADPTKLGISGAPQTQNLQSSYDFSGVPGLPKLEDFNSTRDQITNAYLERLKPYMDQQQQQLDAKLANQGLNTGAQAYNFDQQNLQRGFNDQRVAALLAGDQAAQNLFNNALNTRQQGVNEAIAQGNFGNQSKLDTFNQGLAAANFGNSAQQQEFGQNQQQLQNYNQAQEAMFNQGLASGQFTDQARMQAIQEQDYLRNQPINLLNALRSGNQVNIPTFGQVTAGSNIAPPPIYAATNDQYQGALQKYQAQLAAFGGLLGGLGSIAGAGIGLIKP